MATKAHVRLCTLRVTAHISAWQSKRSLTSISLSLHPHPSSPHPAHACHVPPSPLPPPLTQQQEDQLRDIFQMLDQNSNGYLDEEELEVVVRQGMQIEDATERAAQVHAPCTPA